MVDGKILHRQCRITIDEYSQYRYFAKKGIKVECIQTDDEFEFTKHFGGFKTDDLTQFNVVYGTS